MTSFYESETLNKLAAEIAMARNGGTMVAESTASYTAEPATPQSEPTPAAGELEMVTLASSSKGNAVLVRSGKTAVLVDAGVSARRIVSGLRAAGVAAADLTAVLITHEHSDHVAGLPQLLKQYSLPVYTTRPTWQALGETAWTYAKQFIEWRGPVQIGDLYVDRFAISHDAVDPGGYTFCTASRKAAVCTDLGFVSSAVENALRESDLLVLEANHDPDRLRRGPYAPRLKERILGTRGHLCNLESGRLLARLFRGKAMQVILAHRSETNNTVALAEQTVRQAMGEVGITCGPEGVLWRHGEVNGNVSIRTERE